MPAKSHDDRGSYAQPHHKPKDSEQATEQVANHCRNCNVTNFQNYNTTTVILNQYSTPDYTSAVPTQDPANNPVAVSFTEKESEQSSGSRSDQGTKRKMDEVDRAQGFPPDFQLSEVFSPSPKRCAVFADSSAATTAPHASRDTTSARATDLRPLGDSTIVASFSEPLLDGEISRSMVSAERETQNDRSTHSNIGPRGEVMDPTSAKQKETQRHHGDVQNVEESLGNRVHQYPPFSLDQNPSLLNDFEFIVNPPPDTRVKEQEMAETTVRRLLEVIMEGQISKCDVERVAKTFTFPDFVKFFGFSDPTVTKANISQAISPSESKYEVFIIPFEAAYLIGTVVVFRKTRVAVWYAPLDYRETPGVIDMLPATMNSYRGVFGDWKQVIGSCNKGTDSRTCGLLTIEHIERLCGILSKGDWDEEPNLSTSSYPKKLRYMYASRLCSFQGIGFKFHAVLESFRRKHLIAADEPGF
ncbi:hypothetical protein BP6252_11689 [Coleophoma cylindrospora]|uniref:Uncharacterized protein n=1 Tax=Coleophoma cylindrospora TaxID=1849047 RepID=A0A3D8QKA3_9HELO|nr:hypothetical protein BP6252_11689 [Coleophoma cylindrospora]